MGDVNKLGSAFSLPGYGPHSASPKETVGTLSGDGRARSVTQTAPIAPKKFNIYTFLKSLKPSFFKTSASNLKKDLAAQKEKLKSLDPEFETRDYDLQNPKDSKILSILEKMDDVQSMKNDLKRLKTLQGKNKLTISDQVFVLKTYNKFRELEPDLSREFKAIALAQRDGERLEDLGTQWRSNFKESITNANTEGTEEAATYLSHASRNTVDEIERLSESMFALDNIDVSFVQHFGRSFQSLEEMFHQRYEMDGVALELAQRQVQSPAVRAARPDRRKAGGKNLVKTVETGKADRIDGTVRNESQDTFTTDETGLKALYPHLSDAEVSRLHAKIESDKALVFTAMLRAGSYEAPADTTDWRS